MDQGYNNVASSSNVSSARNFPFLTTAVCSWQVLVVLNDSYDISLIEISDRTYSSQCPLAGQLTEKQSGSFCEQNASGMHPFGRLSLSYLTETLSL